MIDDSIVRRNIDAAFPWMRPLQAMEMGMIFYSFGNRFALAVFLFLVSNSPAWS